MSKVFLGNYIPEATRVEVEAYRYDDGSIHINIIEPGFWWCPELRHDNAIVIPAKENQMIETWEDEGGNL